MPTLTPTQAQLLAQVLDELDPDADTMTDTAAMLSKTLTALPAAGGGGGIDHRLRAHLHALVVELDELAAVAGPGDL